MTEDTSFLRVLEGPHGSGVYTTRSLPKGSHVLFFAGALFSTKDVPWILKPEDDRYLQVGPSLYVGPSGKVDDFVNHSCDPNAAVRINGVTAELYALRGIAAGEEITFDYSTTMFEETWTMQCGCGTPVCRGMILNFAQLPAETQRQYADLGAVPAYILQSLSERP